MGFAVTNELRGGEYSIAEKAATDQIERRGRGFASGREAWAELRDGIESCKKSVGELEKLHKEMWEATKENNEDAFLALACEFGRMAAVLSENSLLLRAMAKIANENVEE